MGEFLLSIFTLTIMTACCFYKLGKQQAYKDCREEFERNIAKLKESKHDTVFTFKNLSEAQKERLMNCESGVIKVKKNKQ